MIRQATPGDAAAISGLWNPYIRDTVVTFNPNPREPDEVAAMIASRAAEGHPFLLSQPGDELLGFASYAQFRPGPGYARTMEHTIILAPAARGQGTGRALMTALEAHARGRGMRAMVGAITATNTDSIAFHARLGFATVGHLPQAGYKFGQHHDLVLMQKLL